MQYAQRLRDLREDRALSQADIARILGTSQSYYAQYENGKRELPFIRAIQLSRFYNVSLDYLAGLTNTPRTLNGKPYTVNKNITITQNGNGNIGIQN